MEKVQIRASSDLNLLEPSLAHLPGDTDALARGVGLEQVEIATDTDDTASQGVIEINGHLLAGAFRISNLGPSPGCAMSPILQVNSAQCGAGEGVSNCPQAAEDGLTLRHWTL